MKTQTTPTTFSNATGTFSVNDIVSPRYGKATLIIRRWKVEGPDEVYAVCSIVNKNGRTTPGYCTIPLENVRPNGRDEDPRRDALDKICAEVLGVHTLETRSNDSLDFYDVAVWTLKEALERAYEAGRKAAK